MQIAVPLGKFRVWEMLVGPVADELVLLEVFFVARRQIGIQRHDNRLALRPPEFHVLRIVLRRQILAVAEIDDAAKLLVPAPVPRPVENLQRELL